MDKSTMTPFTERMYELWREAPHRVKKPTPYYPHDFKTMLDECGGDFAPRAKQLLRTSIQPGFVRLAKGNALDISMEYVIAHDSKYRADFSDEDRKLAKERLDLASQW